MLGGRTVKQIYDLKAEGHSIRGIAERLGIARNTVRTYLRASEIPKPKPRAQRASHLGLVNQVVADAALERRYSAFVHLTEALSSSAPPRGRIQSPDRPGADISPRKPVT